MGCLRCKLLTHSLAQTHICYWISLGHIQIELHCLLSSIVLIFALFLVFLCAPACMCDLGRHLFIVRFDPHLSVRAPKYTHTHSDTTIVFHSREIQFSSIYFSENFERHRQRTASASNRNIFVFASFHFAISFNMELIRNEIAATHSPHTRWPIHTITVTFVSRCTHHCHTMRHLDNTMSTNAISTKNSIFECQRFGPINYRIDTMRGDGKKGISMKKSVRNLLRANE